MNAKNVPHLMDPKQVALQDGTKGGRLGVNVETKAVWLNADLIG